MFPRFDHCTLVTESFDPKSYNFVTFEVVADHKYTQEPKPTARMFEEDQSTKFR